MRACLYCGGVGAIKCYENNAGDFHWEHCVMCDGQGKEIPERLEAVRKAREERDAAYEKKRAEAKWWYRWLI